MITSLLTGAVAQAPSIAAIHAAAANEIPRMTASIITNARVRN
jgi:hypothetical protein